MACKYLRRHSSLSRRDLRWHTLAVCTDAQFRVHWAHPWQFWVDHLLVFSQQVIHPTRPLLAAGSEWERLGLQASWVALWSIPAGNSKVVCFDAPLRVWRVCSPAKPVRHLLLASMGADVQVGAPTINPGAGCKSWGRLWPASIPNGTLEHLYG